MNNIDVGKSCAFIIIYPDVEPATDVGFKPSLANVETSHVSKLAHIRGRPLKFRTDIEERPVPLRRFLDAMCPGLSWLLFAISLRIFILDDSN